MDTQTKTNQERNTETTTAVHFGYCVLDAKQLEKITNHVFNKTVIDLGSGQGQLAKYIAKLGAIHVTCIDKEEQKNTKETNNIIFIKTYFKDYKPAQKWQTALIGWPINNPAILDALKIAKACETIIVISQNHSGTSCGTPQFYKELSKLKVITYMPRSHNTVTIYKNEQTKRKLLKEEHRGISPKCEPFTTEPDLT